MMNNGVFRVRELPAEPMPTLDGRMLGDKANLLAALAGALRFPDYFGGNWDALDECLTDLSWHEGALRLGITHSEQLSAEVRDSLIEIFLLAAKRWAEADRPFALYLA
jgi:RNAse (barnase) inhibitor barstar